MKMLVVEVRDGYGGIFRQFVNPEKVRLFAHKRNGEFIMFDNGDAIEVATPASDLARQWERCNDYYAELPKSETTKQGGAQ